MGLRAAAVGARGAVALAPSSRTPCRLPWYARAVPDESLTGLATSPAADLGGVTAPTLIVHGTRDELSTATVVERVAGACRAARKVVCAFDGAHGDANPLNADVRTCIVRFGPGVWEGS